MAFSPGQDSTGGSSVHPRSQTGKIKALAAEIRALIRALPSGRHVKTSVLRAVIDQFDPPPSKPRKIRHRPGRYRPRLSIATRQATQQTLREAVLAAQPEPPPPPPAPQVQSLMRMEHVGSVYQGQRQHTFGGRLTKLDVWD